MGAIPEETEGIKSLITNPKEEIYVMRTYVSGQINGIDVVLVFSRWGKVAAAATTASLIQKFGVNEIILTGVAGAISGDLKIGDIVLSARLVQHDLDARPLFKQHEIPLLGKTFIESDKSLSNWAERAINKVLETKTLNNTLSQKTLKAFGITHPKLYKGDIASGDVFFSNKKQKENLLQTLPTIKCVEMEGAAVAQVCYEHNTPCVIIRTISEEADEKAVIDFPLFIKEISSIYSKEIIKNMFEKM